MGHILSVVVARGRDDSSPYAINTLFRIFDGVAFDFAAHKFLRHARVVTATASGEEREEEQTQLETGCAIVRRVKSLNHVFKFLATKSLISPKS